MDSALLFRKKAALTEDGLDWLKGSDEFPFGARRNTTGRTAVSAILVRALLAALEGHVVQAASTAHGPIAQVTSKTTPGSAAWAWRTRAEVFVPNGETSKITYHLGVLFIVEALTYPESAGDFWRAYRDLRQAFDRHGKTEPIKQALVVAADELYFLGRYFDSEAPGGGSGDRFPDWTVSDALKFTPPAGRRQDTAPLADLEALDALLKGLRPAARRAPRAAPIRADGFIGWQVGALVRGLTTGLNVLLAGPTGTGKTVAIEEALQGVGRLPFFIAGKEGLQDLDVLGSLLPDPDRAGQLRWVDGALAAAIRAAAWEPVVLVIEEVNRIRPEHMNVMLDAMNPRPGALLKRQGLPVEDDRRYFLVELPLTAEKLCCPANHLQFVATGNFGSSYSVYALDPALRRRFELVLDFDYPALPDEQALVRARVALPEPVLQAACLVAQNSRDLHRRGELPGCVDTASLLIWTRLCAQAGATSVADLARTARLVWADTVCGRDHLGLTQLGKLSGLFDELAAKCKLPEGGLQDVLAPIPADDAGF